MQNITIDITKRGVAPIVNVTDFDAMSRFFALTLMDGGTPYTPPEDATYTVWYKTNDSAGWYDTITLPDETTRPAIMADDNVLTVEIAEAATTSCGELAVMITGDDGYQLTVTGIMTRSADIPGYDGEEVENYYNVYITRMQENAARAENAADIAVAYGATVEVDEAAQQLNITHHSDTEGGVGWLFGSAVTSEASGSVAAFSDGANDVAIKSLVAEITPVQSGSSDPSPTNIRPISGRTGLTVTRAGKNLLPNYRESQTISDVTFTINDDKSVTVSGTNTSSSTVTYRTDVDDVFDLPSGSYKLTGCPTGGGSARYFMSLYYENTLSNNFNRFDFGEGQTYTLTEGTNKRLGVRIGVAAGASVNATFYPMLRPTTITDDTYEPYTAQTYPITWQTEAGTIYGGTLNVTTGVLTVDSYYYEVPADSVMQASSGGYQYFATPNRPIGAAYSEAPVGLYCNRLPSVSRSATRTNAWGIAYDTGVDRLQMKLQDITTQADARTWVTNNPLQIVYKLATPLAPIQLSPTEVKTLLGGNTIYTDAGAVSVEYVADTKLYIDNKVAELQALILEN